MNNINIDGVHLTPLRNIQVIGGNVLHALKKSESSFIDFGEAYFSCVEHDVVKAWKKHTRMTLNLIVPVGAIKFAIIDDNHAQSKFNTITLSLDNYYRLTVAPGLWVGFKGMDKITSILLNIADIEHQPDEVEKVPESEFKFDWKGTQ